MIELAYGSYLIRSAQYFAEDYEAALPDPRVVEGVGHSGADAVRKSADDARGRASPDADLEDDGVPGAEDVCASGLSLAVAGWAVPAGDTANEDAVRVWQPERGYAVLR